MKKKTSIISLLLAIIICLSLFSGCDKSDNSFKYKVLDDGIHITYYEDKSSVSELVVPDEISGKPVTAIDDSAIVNSIYLKKLTLGKNVASIGVKALINNSALEEIAVAPESKSYKSVDGTLYSFDGKELISNPCAGGFDSDGYDSEFIIPNGVETVCDFAFYHNSIKKIVMSDTVKTVGHMAFFRVSNLTQVVFSKSLEVISEDAFSKNSGLTEITIYGGIKRIETNAFFDCPNLLTVNICADKSKIDLQDKWYPTNLGKNIDDLKINFNASAK